MDRSTFTQNFAFLTFAWIDLVDMIFASSHKVYGREEKCPSAPFYALSCSCLQALQTRMRIQPMLYEYGLLSSIYIEI